MPPSLYPLRLDPYLSRPIWGGNKLGQRYGKGAGTAGTIGESWEIYEADTVQNGAYTGATLKELTEQLGDAVLGRAASGNPTGRFPLLIKLIDATQQLSIQVHPNDQQAQELEHEPFGKTEAWYILDADAGASLVYGLAHPLTAEQLRQRSADGTIEADLAHLPVQAGDVVLVPAGTIHAIGAGIVLYEIQQTSSTTYRLYDWNRRGPDGSSRELHLEKAAKVADRTSPSTRTLTPLPLESANGVRRQELVRCPYFVLERATLDAAWTCRPAGRTFLGLTCVAGSVTVSSRSHDWPEENLCPGSSLLLPAALDACMLQPVGDTAEVLVARLP
jgi:mannose-6-phosphate isomerase